jgi:hypothetical protein
VDAFAEGVHAEFAASGPSVRSELVLRRPASRRRGRSDRQSARVRVRLRSFVDFQGLLDLRPLVDRQADRLAADRIYPVRLYIPHRYRLLDDPEDKATRDGLLERVVEWLDHDTARFVMVLGDFGRARRSCSANPPALCPSACPGRCRCWSSCAAWRRRPAWTGCSPSTWSSRA